MHLKRTLLITGALFLIITPAVIPSNHLSSVFAEQSSAIASFMDNVLRQLPSAEVLKIAEEIQKEIAERLDDAQMYEQIRARVASLQGPLDIVKVFSLIRFQKKLLGQQLRTLLNGVGPVCHCLEIGTPATYASTLPDMIKGDIVALLEQTNATDILQAATLNPLNGFKGYDRSIPFDNYAPITYDIPDSYFDIVICAIGLHHAPPERLDSFIASIKRVMRPGGVFLLREHDADSPELTSLAYAAHSIYNILIPGETLEAELKEIRNFHPLSYWQELLICHGFSISPVIQLQEGDSTRNTFIRCTKPASMVDQQQADAMMHAKQYASYHRDGVQAYLTTPEWNNVDAAAHYAEYIKEIPFYEFPYLAHVKTFWQTFAASWRCAAKIKGGNVKLLLSPNLLLNYTLMNLFIGTLMTAEYCAKAALSLPIRMALSGVEATTLLAIVHDPRDELPTIDPSITIKETCAGQIKVVAIPRYMKFMSSLQRLRKSGVTFIAIADNQHIVCKVRYRQEPAFAAQWLKKFTWSMPTAAGYTYAAYLVPVKELIQFINTLEMNGGQLLYVHDF